MKIAIKREEILYPLQHVIGAVERKQTLPILGNVLIKSDQGRLTLTATDLEIELIAHIDLDFDVSLATTLPARKLLDICKALPDQAEIQFTIEDNQVTMTSGRSRFILASLPAKDFPATEDIEPNLTLQVPQSVLKTLIEKTSFAMAQQDVRYYLNGLLVEVDPDKLRLVATDGHRLALSEYEINTGVNAGRQLIMPRKGVLELARLLAHDEAPAVIKISNNHARIETDAISFTTKLIDGKFPDYNRVIPLDGNKTMQVDRDLLKQALHRISILSNEKYRGIRLNLEKDNLSIQANNPDREEAQEEISVEYRETPLEIGFNVTYLLDVLAVIDNETVELRLKDSNSSCVVSNPGSEQYRYVIMPMRL